MAEIKIIPALKMESYNIKFEPIPAAEFTSDFERYRILAQTGAIPVTGQGKIRCAWTLAMIISTI